VRRDLGSGWIKLLFVRTTHDHTPEPDPINDTGRAHKGDFGPECLWSSRTRIPEIRDDYDAFLNYGQNMTIPRLGDCTSCGKVTKAIASL
jgi:hypothetical protein